MRHRLIALSIVLSAGAVAGTAEGSAISLPEFKQCLRTHSVPTTFSRNEKALALPVRLPAKMTLDKAFATCRRFTRWPTSFVNVARLVYTWRDRGVRFRTCMRVLGRDPGPPVIVLFDLGIGLQFPNVQRDPPRTCARLLPSR